MSTSMSFEAPEVEGNHSYCLYLMADCYRGLDQQYDIKFTVKKGGNNNKNSSNSNSKSEEEEDDIYNA